MVNTSSFADTPTKHKDFEGEDLADSFNIVFTGPPYNTAWEQNIYNYAHDVLTEDDMKTFGGGVQNVLARCLRTIKLCSSYHHKDHFQASLHCGSEAAEVRGFC